MILNSKLWQETIATALLAVNGNQQWTRAIERGAKEAEKAYWRIEGDVLVIKSTTSGKLYKVNGHCDCEAAHNGHKACKHRAAKQLITRYRERLATADAAPEPVRVNEVKPMMPAASACEPKPTPKPKSWAISAAAIAAMI